MNSIILRAGVRYIVGLLVLFSIYMLLRGHNEPGGGFIGGLFLGATPESKGLPLSSVLGFDIGVYLAVFGATLSLVFAMEEEV